MKATHSEEFYREQMERMMSRYGKQADLERELSLLINGLELPEQALEVVKRIYAQKVADACKKSLIEKMKTIKDIQSGRASLGYISQRQEVEEEYKLIEGFEFTCLCLADFKKKYGLGA